MSMIRDHFIGPLPTLSPSEKLRRWDWALMTGLMTLVMSFLVLNLVLWRTLPGLGSSSEGVSFHLSGMAWALAHILTGSEMDEAARYLAWWHQAPMSAWVRLCLILVMSGSVSTWVFIRSLVPIDGVKHIEGNRLWRGKEAEQRAAIEARRMGGGKHGWLAIHPKVRWSREHWSKTTLIVGGVGSGKTQILLGLIEQLFERNTRFLSFDVKGDQTAIFPKGSILSPFDKRSLVWDVARDIRTPQQAAIFANTFIPTPEHGDPFWSTAAQMLTEGSIRHLQATKPGEWTFQDLSKALTQSGDELANIMASSFAKAANLIADGESQTTSSILASLAASTRLIDHLAMAWPERIDDHMFSLLDWMRDGYKGKHRQIFLTAGKDAKLTSGFVSTLINVLEPELLSAKLPDTSLLPSKKRDLVFLLDELTSLGHMPIQSLIERGRSKGIKLVLLFQSLEQLKRVYGDHNAKAILDMVGSRIYARVGPGESRQAMVQEIGKRRVRVSKASVSHSDSGRSQSNSADEELVDIVLGSDLTDQLGPVMKGKTFLGNRAILRMGGDLFELLFPPIVRPAQRPGQIEADWVNAPVPVRVVQESEPEPLVVYDGPYQGEPLNPWQQNAVDVFQDLRTSQSAKVDEALAKLRRGR
ncbi:MAG: hypothetical protein B7X45_13145 [Lysobacterales bacterium 15-68-25]|jgi:hypothetical protein|nr:MAG: hypothetical protein B7X45_13145 [Xanthomonadales bacterium 15-68-25]